MFLWKSTQTWRKRILVSMEPRVAGIPPYRRRSKQNLEVSGSCCCTRCAEFRSSVFRISVSVALHSLKEKLDILYPGIFHDAFLDYLFDLVEQTRLMQDDTFNYFVIKLIVSRPCIHEEPFYAQLLIFSQVALNEQFMVVSANNEVTLENGKPENHAAASNRVLRVLMRRLNSSKTFGENMIFMLNRARE